MRSKSLNILFVFWQCFVNNRHVLEVVLTTQWLDKKLSKA